MKRYFSILVLFFFMFSFFSIGEAAKKSSNKKVEKKIENKIKTKISKKKVSKPKTIKSSKKDSLTILGEPIATQEQAVNFIKKSNPKAKLQCSVEEIVSLYYKEAMLEGIRPDIALSQALVETGFFRYGGDVKAWQNNFCGLGSVGGGVKGATFATPQIGVRAHIQHLLVYTTKKPPKTKIVDPRYDMVKKRSDIYGVCETWHDLDGRWAAKGVPYGERILSMHSRLLETKHTGKVYEDNKSEKFENSGKHRVREKIEAILKESRK